MDRVLNSTCICDIYLNYNRILIKVGYKMKKSNSVNPEIELIAVVKDSRAYVVFYILKDNVKRVIWAVKPNGFYYFISFSHHIHWLDKPRLNEEVMIIDNLRAYIEYGRDI